MASERQGRQRESSAQARLRWGRFVIALAAPLAITGALVVAMSQGTLAASFAVSGRDMKVAATRIEGSGYATYPAVLSSANGRKRLVTVVAIRSGRVWGLCQSSVIPTPLGRFVLRLNTPKQQASVQVSNLMVSATSVKADLDLGSLQLNRDAATLDAVPGAVGSPGQYGLQAVSFAVEDVQAQSWAVVSTSLTAQGTHLTIGRTEPECF
ncbi:DUF6230 family protein [Spirillospora sp. NPDC048911]|uniref:DUF6230 family protein n=1 Tax=Spirillospora sp. NPDC048911 TaxID=3364527 RepID=UPI003719B76B